MIIIWNENPLLSHVELCELGRRFLATAIDLDNFESALSEIQFDLEDGKVVDPKRVKELNRYKGEDEVDRYEKYLSEPHMGDCTCFCTTCMKCYTEGLLEVSTISDFSPYSLNNYEYWFAENRSIDEAITLGEDRIKSGFEYNSAWDNNGGQEAFRIHVQRWQAQRETALEQLKAYKLKHGF